MAPEPAQVDTAHVDTAVRHDATRSRYELLLDGDVVGRADYHPGDDDRVLVFAHTLIEPEHRGQGLAALLVRGALDDVRTMGRLVVPRCWYVAAFIDENTEYRDLVADRR
jgi:uncharacterized protein